MLQTALGLSMAGPMVIVGVEFLRGGQPVFGVGFLALGVLALFFPSWLGRRIGGPRTWIRRRLDRRGSDDEEDETDSQSLLSRFRRD